MFMSVSPLFLASLPGACGSDPAGECIAVMCCDMLTALYELSEPKPLGITGVASWEHFSTCQVYGPETYLRARIPL